MRRLLLSLLLIVGATVVVANVAERWLFYPFSGAQIDPVEAGLDTVREEIFEVDDVKLVLWLAEPAADKPVIFYLHGNAGNLADRAGRFQRFLDRGFGLVAHGYRGSSGSEGSPSQDVLVSDAVSIWMALADGDLIKSKAPVAIYGESLGTAVAIQMRATAALNPVKGTQPDAVMLEAPFTSTQAMLAHHYPSLAQFGDSFENQWDGLKWSSFLTDPLLILHGQQDELIPIEMGQQIYAAAPSKFKGFVRVRNAGHTDLWRSDTLPKLWQFLDTQVSTVK